MFPFIDEQHQSEFHFLMTAHEKYNCHIPRNEWASTSYIISGMGVTDFFLSMLSSDMTVDLEKMKEYSKFIPRKKRALLHYAIQQSTHQIEKISFHKVIRQISSEELKLILNAVDTNYFQLALC